MIEVATVFTIGSDSLDILRLKRERTKRMTSVQMVRAGESFRRRITISVEVRERISQRKGEIEGFCQTEQLMPGYNVIGSRKKACYPNN